MSSIAGSGLMATSPPSSITLGSGKSNVLPVELLMGDHTLHVNFVCPGFPSVHLQTQLKVSNSSSRVYPVAHISQSATSVVALTSPHKAQLSKAAVEHTGTTSNDESQGQATSHTLLCCCSGVFCHCSSSSFSLSSLYFCCSS